MRIRSSAESGRIIGRQLREWGQMGVRRMAGTEGCTMEPPADMEYAVEPVGVATATPSAYFTEEQGRSRERERERESERKSE